MCNRTQLFVHNSKGLNIHNANIEAFAIIAREVTEFCCTL